MKFFEKSLDKLPKLWYNKSVKRKWRRPMKRTMTVEDFNTFKALASKYNLAWELVDRNEAWVCIYIDA